MPGYIKAPYLQPPNCERFQEFFEPLSLVAPSAGPMNFTAALSSKLASNRGISLTEVTLELAPYDMWLFWFYINFQFIQFLKHPQDKTPFKVFLNRLKDC